MFSNPDLQFGIVITFMTVPFFVSLALFKDYLLITPGIMSAIFLYLVFNTCLYEDDIYGILDEYDADYTAKGVGFRYYD
jgi:hypothetical protein